MRVRVRYTKSGKLRFVSAIDLGRIWERALRRAELPIAYSEGFTPHPKVSFPDALTLGYASTGEYAELTFAGPIALDRAVRDLDAAFPDGIRVLEAVEVPHGAPRLSRWLQASAWEMEYPPGLEGALEEAVVALTASEALFVDRDRKGEITRADLRPALHQITHLGGLVRVTLHHVEPPMRPREVHLAMNTITGGRLAEPVLITRLAQGQPTDEGLIEALSGRLISSQPEARLQKANPT